MRDHGTSCGCDVVGLFAGGGKSGKESGELDVGCSAEDEVEDFFYGVFVDGFLLHEGEGGLLDERREVGVVHAFSFLSREKGILWRERKFAMIWIPEGEAILSGWNCTPARGSSSWARAMMDWSPWLVAMTLRFLGRDGASTMRLWYRVAGKGDSMCEKRGCCVCSM